MPQSFFRRKFLLLTICMAGAAHPVIAQRIYLESTTATGAISSGALTLPAGGNVNNYPTGGGAVPHDPANTIFLAESTIGYLGPTRAAGANTVQQLSAAAATALAAGTTYKNGSVPGNWQISFPGVIDTATGGQIATATNFDPAQVQTALNLYRTAATISPNDLQAKINFLNAARELMAPYAFAGNNAFARASKERIINGSSDPVPASGQPDQGNPSAISREDAVLQNASGHYSTAARTASDVLGTPDSFLAGFPLALPPGVTENDAATQQLRQAQKALCSTYARSLAFKGEVLLRIHSLRYFLKYVTPTATNPHPLSDYLTALDQDESDLQMHLLIASALETNEWFPTVEFSSARAFITLLSDLHRAMQDGSLTFVGLDSSLNIQADQYPAGFIPFFFDPLLYPNNPTTLAGLLSFTQPLINASVGADNDAQAAVTQLDLNLQSLAQSLNSVNDQYRSQLGQLCGWKTQSINNQPTLVPDTEGALFPPERRPDWSDRAREDQGEIGLQWLEIDKAEARYQTAVQGLGTILNTIDQKRETWRLIQQSRQDMIDNVILPSGEKLAELERASADAKARESEYLAKLQNKKRKRGLLGGIIGSAISVVTQAAMAVASGGTSLAAGVAGGSSGLGSINQAITEYSMAGYDIKGIKSQADLERRLGEINAKRVEIQTLEQAAFQFQQIKEDGYRTEEAVQLLLLEAKSAELQIITADLEVDQAYSKLAGLLNRVSYLLQQFSASLSLVNTNPLNSPDYRLIRNRTVRDAEERFTFAHEWAFLTGRAASYVALGTSKLDNINNINQQILQARTGRRLSYLVDQLNAQIASMSIERGSRTLPSPILVSLRDQIVQRNFVNRDAQGTVTSLRSYPYEAQSIGTGQATTVGSTEAISDAAWTQFLYDHLKVDASGSMYLEIPFRLSLDRWGNASQSHITSSLNREKNPLFSATDYGSIIFYNTSITEAFGVRVDILGRDLEGLGSTGQNVTVTLSAEGTSYIRQQSYNSGPSGGVRTFQFGRDRSAASILASVNGVPANLRNPQLHERSPANDRWVIRIYEGAVNDILLEQLDRIKDIRIYLAVSSYTQL